MVWPRESRHLSNRQIVSKAVSLGGVFDIFVAAGLKKPEISLLSDEFLAEVRGMPQSNLAVETLCKLLGGEIKTRRRMSSKPDRLQIFLRMPSRNTKTVPLRQHN